MIVFIFASQITIMTITQLQYVLAVAENKNFTNVEIYHKQMSVLPYASSLTGVAIRPTKEGVIKHKALSAMEEQTNMQLNLKKNTIYHYLLGSSFM